MMTDALKKLQDAVHAYENTQNLVNAEKLRMVLGDSMILRFKVCVDLLWKYVKEYLENVELIPLEINTPCEAIRELCAARVITEQDAEHALDMMKHRNMSSHIYHEEIAEIISGKIPGYVRLMHVVVDAIERHLV